MPAEATTGPVLFSDKLIAEELGKLSLEEREKVYEDVHGVSHLVEETPELIEESLELMEIEIHSIRQKDAYDQAKLLSNGFVTNRKFLLGFLRAESFNAKKAAARFTKYFKCKLKCLGCGILQNLLRLKKLVISQWSHWEMVFCRFFLIEIRKAASWLFQCLRFSDTWRKKAPKHFQCW